MLTLICDCNFGEEHEKINGQINKDFEKVQAGYIAESNRDNQEKNGNWLLENFSQEIVPDSWPESCVWQKLCLKRGTHRLHRVIVTDPTHVQKLHYAIQPQERIWSIAWGGYCPKEGKSNYNDEVEVVP